MGWYLGAGYSYCWTEAECQHCKLFPCWSMEIEKRTRSQWLGQGLQYCVVLSRLWSVSTWMHICSRNRQWNLYASSLDYKGLVQYWVHYWIHVDDQTWCSRDHTSIQDWRLDHDDFLSLSKQAHLRGPWLWSHNAFCFCCFQHRPFAVLYNDIAKCTVTVFLTVSITPLNIGMTMSCIQVIGLLEDELLN